MYVCIFFVCTNNDFIFDQFILHSGLSVIIIQD